ncbi:hypothetical protein RhiirB3_530939 [Rhizophagus irregularis]|nr:hypothetical protein RhiirB3_530939 [Rhizophagus irregularis]
MRSEKRKPYLEIKQASKDYTETNFKEGGYSNVYLASWNNGLYFEAPNNVREFGLQSLSLSDNKKKSDEKIARLEYENINGADFIRQLDSYYTVMSSEKSPILYRISRDSETNDCILVMQYANGGDLRQYLQDNFTKGLKAIHNHGYVHRNFHGENVLLDLSKSFEEIINGLRPEIIKGTPKSYLYLMIKCWDNPPLNRTNINEIIDIIENWKIQWNLNPEIIEVAEIELVK